MKGDFFEARYTKKGGLLETTYTLKGGLVRDEIHDKKGGLFKRRNLIESLRLT